MQTVSWAGSTYNIPNQRGDTPWSGLSDFAIAVASKGINTGGGNFTLLADVNLGANFGLLSAYFSTRTALPATAGLVRLAKTDVISWKNNAGSGNINLSKNTSDELLWNSSRILLAGGGLIVNADVSASAAIAYSKLALTASIVNADVSASAAIAYSKLALTGSIVNADVNAAAAIAYSKLALTGSIVNADLSASAAIAFSKLAALASGKIIVGSAGTVPTEVAVSGDATLAASGALTLATVNSNVGSFTNSSITVNAKGLVTAASSGSSTTITDWASYVPTVTGCGTISFAQAWWMQIGNHIWVKVGWKCGTPSAAVVGITLPANVNYSKGNTNVFPLFGSAIRAVNGAGGANVAADLPQAFSYGDNTQMFLGNSNGSGAPIKTLGSTMFNALDWIAASFDYPI